MVNCSDLRCKYRNEKGKCTCKNVNLTSWGVHTKHMGYKNFLECKSFEYDEEYKRLGEKMKKLGIINLLEWEQEEIESRK